MIKFSILPLLCVTASLALHGSLAAQGEQTLRTTAKKGASVWLLQEQKSEQSIDQGGQQFELTNTRIHTLHVTVLDVDDKGTMTVETEIVRIHGSIDMGPMGEGEFDSATPGEAEEEDSMGMGMSPAAMGKQMTKLAGKKFVAKVDNRGKAASLEGVAELLKNGRGAMGMATTEADLKMLVEGAFGALPEKPVAVGGTWDHVEKESGRMGVDQKTKLTLSKFDDASFEITASGTIEKTADKEGAKEEDDPSAAMRKNATIQNGKLTATIRISRQDGFVLEGNEMTSMDVEMETPMGAMSMTMKQTKTTKRTTAEAAMPKKAEKDKAAPAKEEKKEGGK